MQIEILVNSMLDFIAIVIILVSQWILYCYDLISLLACTLSYYTISCYKSQLSPVITPDLQEEFVYKSIVFRKSILIAMMKTLVLDKFVRFAFNPMYIVFVLLLCIFMYNQIAFIRLVKLFTWHVNGLYHLLLHVN